MTVALIEKEVDIRTADGSMNTLIVRPAQPGAHPVVFFYMDAAGRRDELSDMARRIASAGYYTVLPNLYYRTTPEFRMRWSETGIQEMLRLMETLTNGLVADDTEALLRFVDEQPEAMAARIGAVGYCMSGPFVIAAAERFPDRIDCAASFHGANLVTDREDSPHRLVKGVKAEMYFGCAEIDKWADKATIATLAAALDQGSAPHRIEWYPGARHGFVFPGRANVYDQVQAERHWERLLSLFARCLR
ncbi:carboxymethylenebutenolidase [Variovorax sp. YR266]|uniref:dienelactone hydrolase family protein n=1 Tax=Variovorax sp. YR266 TaxID=1884386 RepID=UPI00089808F5|nr:dienelactone hydrolase family protein [Variovorax sp. YR266]SDY34360.1 carboxymethylenebutenolidase [Variovorax sp. YR266]